jgi:hypothetical protein
MVLCPLDVFFIETSAIAPCFLADECKSRYDNLENSRNTRSAKDETTNVQYKMITQSGEFTVFANALQQAVASAALIFFVGIFF